ncbi:hypothetical protein OG787_12245 [Streptomyces sp. NBC_00075]|uniref:DUF6603 domain-containing protein n=1 Tax=Streptomyces sp. NBC_00075 TaxID=2975641 RepID=UPI0032560BDD
MPGPPGTLDVIARELATALAPLEERLAGGNAAAFLDELGLRLPGGFEAAAPAIGTTALRAAALPPAVATLVSAIEDEDTQAIASAGIALVGVLREVIEAIGALGPALDAAVAAEAALTPAQRTRLQQRAASLPGRLLDWMVVEYLRRRGEGLHTALTLLGIIDDITEPGDPADPLDPPRRVLALRPDRLISLVTAPDAYLRTAFRFGEPDFDGRELFTRLAAYLDSLHLAVDLLTPPGAAPILEAYVLRLSTDQTASPPSLTARMRLPASRDVLLTIPLGGAWSLTVTAAARFDAGLEAEISPPLEFRLQPPTGGVSADIGVGLAAERPDATPMVLLGQAGGSRLELRRFAVALGLAGSAGIGAPLTVEPSARLRLEGGRLIVDLSQGDGFIAKVAGGLKIDANLDLAALWSPSTGLRIQGSGGIEIAIPTHLSLGPIDVTQLYLRVSLGPGSALPIELSGAFTAALGPLDTAVDRIGLVADLSFPPGGGNLGPLDLGFRFKPPNGVGLAVNAGVVQGGGYLYIDTERGEYAGVLELDLAGIVSVKAIGLITTRMPDGSDGFSLLLVITAEFGTGVQLGFGFTLLAVGGILGLNRTVNLPALVEGVRGDTLSSVMFPRDVVANAQRIISDLRTFFPTRQGGFVIGPMAKIGWGTPTLVSLSLGVVIGIPGNIAILGVLRIALPADDAAVIVLQVNFIGAIEFDKRRVYFFASIFDSRILFLTIEGEMAVLAAFGEDSNFVLSVGGFHPSFEPPPMPVPVPRRIAVDIVNTPAAKLRVEGYFAVTTNTAQFGARLDLMLGTSDFGVTGHLAFDALFQFSPFHFVVAISAAVALRAFGADVFSIRLRFELSGPTPWRAKGTGSLSFLFFEIEVDFDETFGEERHAVLPDILVMPLVGAEYDKAANWRTMLPPGAQTRVSLRALAPAADALVLHPVGVLQVSQRLVPLDQNITRVGNSKVADARRLTLEAIGPGLAEQADVVESFAPAQYQDLDDAAKLSRPAFEPGHGGIALSTAGDVLRSGAMVRRVVRYELITVDTGWRRVRKRFRLVLAGLFGLFLRGGAVSRSALSEHHTGLLEPFAEKVTVRAEGYVVASVADNTTVAAFSSETLARDHLARRAAADPALGASLHVIPAFEAVAA